MSNPNMDEGVNDIAIIGLEGRFPRARNIEEFWKNLRDGVHSISFFNPEEMEFAMGDRADLDNRSYVKAGGVLDDVESFDALFFGFTPREAEIMDPQHRIFLECAWTALEDAGYDPETYRGRIGVYAGAGMNNYLFNVLSNHERLELVSFFQVLIGNESDHLPTKVSYNLNLKGPSINCQTACSTSLVAVSMACQSLLDFHCDMALAGGVSIKTPQKEGYLYEEGGINSPDGYCRAFDAEARGTVGGNGIGIVVLKRLADALRDGDCIHALIKGFAINNDGSEKVGYTAPGVDGQAEVIAEALAVARVAPETISYVEAHGTGTALGDSVEIAALTKAFRAGTDKRGFCPIGSVKTNVGHLNTASGVTGLIKTVLALKNEALPPSLHFQRPNPKIDFAASPFYVNSRLTKWVRNGTPRRAGVSSFGIGGTNTHVIVEEAPHQKSSRTGRPGCLLLLSAKTESALENATTNLAEFLKQHDDINLADVAYTLQVGRRAFNYRRALVCRDATDAAAALEARHPQRMHTGLSARRDRSVAMMFSGQGTQYADMGRELYYVEPSFRRQVDLCAEMLVPHLGYDLRKVLYPTPGQPAANLPDLNQTCAAQPALFVTEYALAQLWMTWGVRPEAMIGHSLGEYVAACLAGVMSLADALMLVAVRGMMAQQLTGGRMLALLLPEADVHQLIRADERLSLAAVNSPQLCVVSGPADAVGELESFCNAQGVDTRSLRTSHAFHSSMMEAMLGEFTESVQKVALKPPQIPFISNLTGTWITTNEATDPGYWANHLQRTVRFADGVSVLLNDPNRIMLEVGPGQTLSTAVKQTSDEAERLVLSSLRHPLHQQSDTAFLLNTLGNLWVAGKKIDWPEVYAHERRCRTTLPTYPFERSRYWVDLNRQALEADARQSPPDRREDVASWFYLPVWKQSPAVEMLESAETTGEKLSWLMFTDGCGVGSAIARRLELHGHEVITVRPGPEFTKLAEQSFQINPRRRDDYDLLLRYCLASNRIPRRITHLWGVTPDDDSQSSPGFSQKNQERGVDSLLLLTQAIGARNITEALQLDVVTNNLYDITGQQTLHPWKATILGACVTIPQEFPNISCRSIDVLNSGTIDQPDEELINRLADEISAKPDLRLVAYRGGRRWVRGVEAVRLNDNDRRQPPLRSGGVYLITGGLRGIGLELANSLARTEKAKLVLTYAPDSPEMEMRRQGIAVRGNAGERERRVSIIRELEKAGAEILVSSLDVADQEQTRSLIAEARERFGQLNGVFHTEETFRACPIELETPQAASDVFRSKVHGTLALNSALKDVALDFFALFSSSITLDGAPGQFYYCAASAFLDAFAHYSSAARERLTIAVDWDPGHWENWQETLTEVLPQWRSRFQTARENRSLTPEEGVKALRRVLSHRLPQVIVSTQNRQLVDEQVRSDMFVGLLGELKQAVKARREDSIPEQSSAEAAPANQIEQTIAGIWQELFGVESVGVHDNFFELGGNSLLGIQLMSRMRKVFMAEIPMNSLFDSPTVTGLAHVVSEIHLKEKGAEELEQMIAEIESLSAEDVELRLNQ